MTPYRGFRIPEELAYDLAAHVWVRMEGEFVVVGATDPAQGYAGEILHIGIKKPGTRLARGAILATVESAKYIGPMRAPVTGTIEEVNEAVAKSPSLVNRDPYANWVAKLRPENLDQERGLLTPGTDAAGKYRPILDEWDIQAPPPAA